MAKAKTTIEKRADLAAQIMGLDLARAELIKEIFERPEMIAAAEELREIYDPAPATITGTAASDVNVLIKHALTLFDTVGAHAEAHIAALNAALNPPPAPAMPGEDAPAASPPATPQTPEA